MVDTQWAEWKNKHLPYPFTGSFPSCRTESKLLTGLPLSGLPHLTYLLTMLQTFLLLIFLKLPKLTSTMELFLCPPPEHSSPRVWLLLTIQGSVQCYLLREPFPDQPAPSRLLLPSSTISLSFLSFVVLHTG